MRRTEPLGWVGIAILFALAVAGCWLAAQRAGHNGCPWPEGDPRNPTGCVVYVTTTPGR